MQRKGDFMATLPVQTKPKSILYTLNDAVEIIFSKLDEAIDDLENGRVFTEQDVLEEIDAI